MARRWHVAAHNRPNGHQEHGRSTHIVLRHMNAHGGLFVIIFTCVSVNMPLSPPTFEAICEIGIFTAASLHIERLHIAAPACLLYTQHQLASVHVHSAPHAARAACTCTYKAPFIKPPFTVATSIVRLLCTF